MRRRIVRNVGDDTRVRLPSSLREALKISEGDVLELTVSERGDVLVQKAVARDDGAPAP